MNTGEGVFQLLGLEAEQVDEDECHLYYEDECEEG